MSAFKILARSYLEHSKLTSTPLKLDYMNKIGYMGTLEEFHKSMVETARLFEKALEEHLENEEAFTFKPIAEAPIAKTGKEQILCRFLYRQSPEEAYYVYFVALPNGSRTQASGYAPPEEWCELPKY